MPRKHIVVPKELALLILASKKYKTFSSGICGYAEKGLNKLINLKFSPSYIVLPSAEIELSLLEPDPLLTTPHTHEIIIHTATYERIKTFAVNEHMSFSKAICYLAYLGLGTEYKFNYEFDVDRR